MKSRIDINDIIDFDSYKTINIIACDKKCHLVFDIAPRSNYYYPPSNEFSSHLKTRSKTSYSI